VSNDPYVYPGTDVLRNIPGIRDGDELERFEARLTFLRGLQLASEPIAGAYDLDHLQAFHRFLFADLYEWAGELRTVVLAKTDLFCLPEHIESYGAEIFGKLAEEGRLRSLNRDRFIDRLAHYVGDVNALHPFRDGNGRAQRAFFAQLASDAGYRLDWQLVDPQENIDASVAAMQGDEKPMRSLLGEIVHQIAAA
jgi:cell filamentation protein, protein adenylyltransferase